MATGPLRISTRDGRTDLLLHGTRVIDRQDDLRRIVDERLGAGTANLFATPRRESDGTIAWFDPAGSGESVPLAALPVETRGQAEAAIGGLCDRLEGLFDDADAGPLVLAALNVDSDESIRMIGDRPVLVGWGGLPTACTTQDLLVAHHSRTIGPFVPHVDFPLLDAGPAPVAPVVVPAVAAAAPSRAGLVASAVALVVLLILLVPGVLRWYAAPAAAPGGGSAELRRQLEQQVAERERTLGGDVCRADPARPEPRGNR